MNNLTTRIITSIFLILILILGLFYSKHLWLVLLISSSLIIFIEFYKIIKKIWKGNIKYVFFIGLISFIYLICFTYFSYDLSKNKEFILTVLLVCIFSDIGGYTVGKVIGGKKLTKISPNKTISGSFGSFLFAFIPILFVTFVFKLELNFNYDVLFWLCLIISFINQAGDIFISYFKRKAKVKDTGTILPGHGGLLDRIDGIIFAVPAAYFINKIFLNL